MSQTYQFTGCVWKDPTPSGWFFVKTDKKLSERIKRQLKLNVSKLGLVKATATVGQTTWKTTLFPTKAGHYVFAIKLVVRQKEKIKDKDVLKFRLSLA